MASGKGVGVRIPGPQLWALTSRRPPNGLAQAQRRDGYDTAALISHFYQTASYPQRRSRCLLQPLVLRMYLRPGTLCVILVVMSERGRTRDAERAVKSTAQGV